MVDEFFSLNETPSRMFNATQLATFAELRSCSLGLLEAAAPLCVETPGNDTEDLRSVRIMIVDDEMINIEVVKAYLEKEGFFNFLTTTRSTIAIDDHELKLIPAIVLTASHDPHIKLNALRLGASDFLAKPIDPSELMLRLHNVLAVKAYQDHLAKYSERLEEDVGKIGIPDAILHKPEKLDPQEFEIIRGRCGIGRRIINPLSNEESIRLMTHATVGMQIMGSTNSPVLKLAAVIAASHHEKWDGAGYPNQIAGDKIPLEGRIVAIADVFDALSSTRPYKEAFPIEKCLQILRVGRGSHFDPNVLDAFFRRRDEAISQYSR